MTRLETIENKVKIILLEYPDTRDSDKALYSAYCLKYRPDMALMTFRELMSTELPNYESVTRARRKLQVKCPELRGKRYIERYEAEQEYIEYAQAK